VVISHVKQLFVNVFWPAAAGNVFWAMITLLITGANNDRLNWYARLGFLLFLSIYISCVWIDLRKNQNEGTYGKWIVEGLYIWTIVYVALCAQIDPSKIGAGLCFLFLFGFIGHHLSYWTTEEESSNSTFLSYVNLFGIILILLGVFLEWPTPYDWLVAIVFVSFSWALIGRRKNIWSHM